MNIGYLIAYVLGAFVDYDYIPYICATITIIFCVPFILLPNTPRYHLANGNVQVSDFQNLFSQNHINLVAFMKF